MDPIPITLPSRPKAERPAEPRPPATFNTFVDGVGELLKPVRARLEQRGEDSDGATWWLTFNRASCLYRFRSDRQAEQLVLEKGQGSFVPNSQPSWRTLDSRPMPDPDFDGAFHLVKEMLTRFVQP